MFGILKKTKEAVSLAERAIKNAEYWKGQAELWKQNLHRSLAAQDRFAKFLVTENVRLNESRAHLEKVLARKNRRLKKLEPVWRKEKSRIDGRQCADLVTRSMREDDEYYAMLKKASELDHFMTMKGFTAFGPIEQRR